MRLPVLSRPRWAHHALREGPPRPRAAALVIAVASAALIAVPAGAATAAPAAPAATQAPARASGVTTDPESLAAAQARRTGKPVVIQGLTTPASLTQVLPDGQYEMTTSSRPVRTWTRGAWRNLNATLTRNSDGTWSPAASSQPISISGGGTAALATMTASGRSLALDWPGSLPRPQVTGDTAVYRSVFPGVDLQVTVSDDGGVRDVLVIRDRAAAASPALRHLALTAETTGGLRLAASAAGTLQVATATGVPAFTAPAPLMWDSATTATSTARTTATAGSAQRAAAAIATAGASTTTQPGRGAHAAWVKESIGSPQFLRGGVTRQSLALIPDATLLAGPSTVFPAYVDPTWYSSGGSRGWYASTNTLYPNNNEYDNTADPQGDLQVGCNGQFCAHTLVQMLLNSSQLKGATINSAVIQFTQVNGGSCSSYPVELWAIGSIPTVSGKPFASWDDEPSWLQWNDPAALSDGGITSIATQYAWPSGNCGTSGTLNFNITKFMQDNGPAGHSAMDFGLKATDTNVNDAGSWRELSNASGAITMTTYYDHAPDPQADSVLSPGGACQSSSATKTIVGNDDFTLSTVPSDTDGGPLTVTFVVTSQGSTTALASASESATSGRPVSFSVPATQVQGWHSDGETTSYPYSWYTYTTDSVGLDNKSDTGLGSPAQPCLFTYDPTAPQAPGVTGPTDAGALGTTATFKFGECSTEVESTPGACASGTTLPTTYTYQVDDGPYQKVAVNGGYQQVNIPLTRYGQNTITVTGISAAGNPSAPATWSFGVDKPATAYPDGDYAGTGHPDLITVGDGTGTSTEPGLWLAESDGNGELSTPIDIGVRGTGLNTEGTPADWAATQVLHGDFTGNGVQDIVAYYPGGTVPGELQIIGGPGTAAALEPESGNIWTANQNPLADLNVNSGQDAPTDVVAAGNASLQGTGKPDLIAIDGDSSSGYELNVYDVTTPTALDFGTMYDALNIVASTGTSSKGPDGQPWGPDWTLQVAQPGGQAVLFALDNATGELWESVNPVQTSTSLSTLIGMPGSTWTRISGGPSWSGSGPALVQADVNTAGSVELWTRSGGTATSWSLSGSALTQEAANTLVNPAHEWPLTDVTSTSASVIDTESSATATSTGLQTPATPDVYLGPVAQFGGMADQSSISLPAGILQNTAASGDPALQSMTLTMRFMAAPGTEGILAGTSTGSLTDPALSNKSAPILYIGTDGHLYAQFPSAHVNSTGVVAQDIAPLESTDRVDDGLWHTVTLVADGSSHHDEVLYLDNDVQVHAWDNGIVDTATPLTIVNPGQTSSSQSYGPDNVTIGAGIYSTAGWVNADAMGGNLGTTRASYFTGEISDVAFYPEALSVPELPHNTPGSETGVVNSGVLATQCMDNANDDMADGNIIQIYACNGSAAQNWVFQVKQDGAMTISPASNLSYCVNVTANGTANGTPIELYGCNGNNGQYFEVLPNGSIMNQGSGKCIDDPNASTTQGTQLQLFTCNGSNAQTWASPVRPAELAPVGTAVAADTGFCAQNAGGSTTSAGSTASGSQAQAGTCLGYLSQQLTYQANGTITVAGLCLNNTGGNTGDDNAIDFATCNSTSAQIWAHPDTGGIMNYATGKCVQEGSTTSGAQLKQYTCSYNANQTWDDASTWNR